jgi:hypothetical protein
MARTGSGVLGWLRRAWPWLVGAVILAAVVRRVPLAAFRQSIGSGPHLALAGVNLAINVSILCTDSIATWVGLIAAKLRRPFGQVMAVRGATYALFVVNYAVAQGAFGYYLHRTGVRPLRATGATLFLIGTNLATLLVVTALAWTLATVAAPNAGMQLSLEVCCAAFAAYLAVIALAPTALARRELFAPLFDAGLRGHAVAMFARLPHVAVMVLGHWVAIRTWGIPVPLSAGLTIMPAVVIASALPISPGGLGTTQAAFVYFFGAYAVGATADARAATVFAFAIVHFVYGVLASLAVGLACMPFAKKSGVLAPATVTASAASASAAP